ncbi:MAG: putative toxin-antitoxin system toxin component, PIN family [Dehalococcoidia bacterium]
MRAVLDTAVFVRALINPRGKWGRFLSEEADKYAIVVSPVMVREVIEVLFRPELRERFPRMARFPRLDWVLEKIEEGEVVQPRKRVEVCRDPADDKFFECAVAGKAGYVVSVDKGVLAVGEHGGIRTISAAEFLALVAPEDK